MGDEVWLANDPSENQTSRRTRFMPVESKKLIVTGISFDIGSGRRTFQLRDPDTEDFYRDGEMIPTERVTLARKARERWNLQPPPRAASRTNDFYRHGGAIAEDRSKRTGNASHKPGTDNGPVLLGGIVPKRP